MPPSPRVAAAAQKRALVSLQADLRRLNIIKTNQARLVQQIEQLVARYNKAETLADQVQKKADATLAGIGKNAG
ncbi:MAG: hypothetical protein WD402_09080 [Chloroflexota bacterium]